MPLPAADEGMPLFPQPQGLRGSANAGPQTLTRQGGKEPFSNDKPLSVLAPLGHLSHRERQGVLTMIQEQAQQIILLCLLTV